MGNLFPKPAGSARGSFNLKRDRGLVTRAHHLIDVVAETTVRKREAAGRPHDTITRTSDVRPGDAGDSPIWKILISFA